MLRGRTSGRSPPTRMALAPVRREEPPPDDRQHRPEEQPFLPPRPSAISPPSAAAPTLAAIDLSVHANATLRRASVEPLSEFSHRSAIGEDARYRFLTAARGRSPWSP